MSPALTYGRLVLAAALALPQQRLAAAGLLLLPPITMLASPGSNRGFLLFFVALIAGQAGWRVAELLAGSGQAPHTSLPITRRTRIAVTSGVVLLLSVVPVCLPAVLWYGPSLARAVHEWLPVTVVALAGPLAAAVRVAPALQAGLEADRTGQTRAGSLLRFRPWTALAAGVGLVLALPLVSHLMLRPGGPMLEPTLAANWLSVPRSLGWSGLLFGQLAAVLVSAAAPGLSESQLPVFLRRLPLSPEVLARRVVAERVRVGVLLAVGVAAAVTALNLLTGANGVAAVLPHLVFGLGTAGIVSLFGGRVQIRPGAVLPAFLVYGLLLAALAMDLGGFELSWADMWIPAAAACACGLVAHRLAVRNLTAVLKESSR